MYQDEFQVYELLDRFNSFGPPVVEEVSALFTRNPDAARRDFAYGQTLLHTCMQNYSNHLDLAKIFYGAYPESISTFDNEGYLPIHRALLADNRKPNLDVIKFLILSAGETILESTSLGEFPLHLACKRSSSVDVVQFLIDCFPDVLQYRDRGGKFPLDHVLDGYEINKDILQLLLQRYPVLLTFINDQGILPLHNILGRNHKRYDDIVDILIEYGPGALRFQELKGGKTPLLQACSNDNSLSQIYCLVRNWPEQVSAHSGILFYETNFNGELLPSALMSKSSRLDHVQDWVRLHPGVVHTPDTQGRVPLHYAVVSESHDALDIVQFLLDESELSTVLFVDQEGRLPLHYAAAASTCQDGVINILIDKYPEGLQQTDNDGRLPWHYADCARKSFVFDRTVELYPDSEIDLELVPDEVRWDIVQIIPDNT